MLAASERPVYLASEMVDWVRVDRVGCVDCEAAAAARGDVELNDVDEAMSEEALCHHVMVELLAQSRVIQVSLTH